MAKWVWPKSDVLQVLDGDSFVAMLHRDIGFGISQTLPMRLRLNRINAPSVKTKRGKEAQNRVVVLLGNAVDLETIKAYKFGNDGSAAREEVAEYMAEVTLADGRNLSDVLVSEGLAVYWDGQGARPSDV